MLGEELFDGADSVAVEFSCDGFSPGQVGIHDRGQTHIFVLFGQLLVNPRMVAPECACSDYRNWNHVVRGRTLLF